MPSDKQALRIFARVLAQRVASGRAFTCLLATDIELLKLNNQFLGRNYPTDVLSFPAPAQNSNLGEIAISIERAAAQAQKFGHSPLDEIRVLMLHGLLHLTGMDHERDRGEMKRAEQEWREELSLPSSLIARQSEPILR